MAWTAAMKKTLAGRRAEIDPRYFLSAAQKEMVELYKKEIKLISR
jgi:fructose/tagatose bisphosphate aldolase